MGSSNFSSPVFATSGVACPAAGRGSSLPASRRQRRDRCSLGVAHPLENGLTGVSLWRGEYAVGAAVPYDVVLCGMVGESGIVWYGG